MSLFADDEEDRDFEFVGSKEVGSKSLNLPKVETPELTKFLSLLPAHWPTDKFILCGSAGLAFRKIRDVHDLDVFILPELWETASEISGEIVPSNMEYGSLLEEDPPLPHRKSDVKSGLLRLDTGLDIFDKLPTKADIASFERALECADRLYHLGKYYRVLCLRHILAIKALAMVPDREKDFEDMKLLSALIENEEQMGIPVWRRALSRKYAEREKAKHEKAKQSST